MLNVQPEVVERSVHDNILAESCVKYPGNLGGETYTVSRVQPDNVTFHSLHLTCRAKINVILFKHKELVQDFSRDRGSIF